MKEQAEALMATHLAPPEQSGSRLATRSNLTSRCVLTKEEQSALSRRLFEVVLAGMPYSEAATLFGMCQQNCRRRFFRVARLAVGRLSMRHRLDPPFHEQHVTVMRQHKEAWLRAYDHALEPISKSECQKPAAVSLSQLRLSRAVEACLRHAGIRTLADILNMTEDEFLNKRYLGKSTLRAIQELLTRLGVSFKPSDKRELGEDREYSFKA